MQHQLWRSG